MEEKLNQILYRLQSTIPKHGSSSQRHIEANDALCEALEVLSADNESVKEIVNSIIGAYDILYRFY